MTIRTAVRCVCVLGIALTAVIPEARAASPSAPAVLVSIPFGKTHQAGLAVAGSSYVYAGTSTNDILHMIDVQTMKRVATWHLLGLGGATFTMDRLALSPDNRRLFILNSPRQDILVVDTTAVQTTKRWNLTGTGPLDVKVSVDSKRVYVVDRRGADIYDASSGRHLGLLPKVSEVAPGPNNGVYTMSIRTGHATIRWVSSSGKGRTLASWSGSAPATTGDIALSTDGRVVYALWDSFRELDESTGRILRSVSLPLIPHYRWISLSPNGQQAMLTAPNFAGDSATPGINPGYIASHFGFVAGGVVPIDLVYMRPVRVSTQSVISPHQLAYTSDSRWAFVTASGGVDALATGIAGVDRAKLPGISLHPNGSGSGTSNCNVAGTWFFVPSTTTGALSDGSAQFQQSGSTLTGKLTTLNDLAWSIQGSINKRGVILTLHSAGRSNLSYTGTVASNNSSITGNLGTFTNGHAVCS